MSGFDWSNFDNSRKNYGVSKTLEHEFDDVHRMAKHIKEELMEEYRAELSPRFQTYYSNGEILIIAAFCVGILIVLILLIFGSTCRKRTQAGRVLSTEKVLGPGAIQQNQEIPMRSPGQGGPVPPTGRVFGPGAVQQNQQIPMRSPGQGGAVPPNIGMPYSNKTLNEKPSPYHREPPSYLNESGKDNVKYVNEQSFHK